MSSLAICASSGVFSCALRTGDGAIRVAAPRNDQHRDLAGLVRDLFQGAGLAPDQLEEVRIDLGPGSYTGLRVAVTFVRTLMTWQKLRVLTATSLELLAIAAWRDAGVAQERAIRPVLDARRERFHTARIEAALQEPPRAVTRQELLASIRPDELIVAAPALAGILSGSGAGFLAAPGSGAAHLFDPALVLRPAAREQLEPLYLMGSYAD